MDNTAGDKSSPIDLAATAQSAGLLYVSDTEPGICRRRTGRGFSFRGPDGKTVTDKVVLARIRSLAIPPAWSDVWICAHEAGHIQATGRDARGRKQYRYHPAFREAREADKYERLIAFAHALPTIRERVAHDMGRRGLPREKVLATTVHLLETTLIRVGNADYARQNKSYGLTTLRDPHVKVEGDALRFQFKGKSGKVWRLKVKDRRIARIVKACQDLPGQDLLQYLDDEGKPQAITSADVNAYLRDITGEDITAKDFRTWAGTLLAALALQGFESVDSQAKAKKNVRAAIERVATRLGNTPTICRKCYIHPEILNSYLDGGLLLEIKQEVESELRTRLAGLSGEEAAVLALLQQRLALAIDDAEGVGPDHKTVSSQPGLKAAE